MRDMDVVFGQLVTRLPTSARCSRPKLQPPQVASPMLTVKPKFVVEASANLSPALPKSFFTGPIYPGASGSIAFQSERQHNRMGDGNHQVLSGIKSKAFYRNAFMDRPRARSSRAAPPTLSRNGARLNSPLRFAAAHQPGRAIAQGKKMGDKCPLIYNHFLAKLQVTRQQIAH